MAPIFISPFARQWPVSIIHCSIGRCLLTCSLLVAGFCFIGLAFRKDRRDRLFHYITAAVVFVAAIAYFTMGSNLGFTPIQVEYVR
jgi:bacteriorhodopsin